MSVKRAIGRGLLKLVKWMGVTLAREGVDLIVKKTTEKQPDDTLKITPVKSGAVAVDVRFREAMLTASGRDELDAEIRRIRGQQL